MKLPNPLDKFISHSVHYVMLAAPSTSDLNVYNENVADGSSPSLDAIDKAKFLGDVVSFNGSNTYLVLDTRRFSQFLVTNVKSMVMPTGITKDFNVSPNGITQEFEFSVIDPMGILFSNFLQYLMDNKLQVSFEGMACLFRVIFVGHLADGTTETVSSVAIPCFFDVIKLELVDSRGIYECKMIPLIGANNSTSHRKWTNIGTASKFFTGKNDNTLGAIITSFESALNKQSSQIYDSINKNNEDGKIGRKVEYMITIPEKWESFQMTGPNQGRIEETDFVKLVKNKEQEQVASETEKKKKQAESSGAKETNIAVEPNMSILQTLDIIFSQCVEMAKIANFSSPDKTDKISFYKHLVNVTSDTDTFMIHVDVVEYVVPNVNKTKKEGGSSDLFYTSTKNGITTTIPKNAVEYDYTFSGTNVDVLEMILNFENLNYLLMSPTKIGSAQLNKKSTSEGQTQKNQPGSTDTSTKLANGIRKNDPVLLSDRTWADDKNHTNIANNIKNSDADPREIHQQYIKNLAAFYSSGQSPEASVSIRGNPYLLTSTSLSSLMKHYKYSAETKKQYRKEFEERMLKIQGLDNMPRDESNSGQLTGSNFISGPMFFKINIYGPNLDVSKNMLTHEVNPEVDYSRIYFDQNYYFVSSIESEIADGISFKHTVHLNPFGVYGVDFRRDDEEK